MGFFGKLFTKTGELRVSLEVSPAPATQNFIVTVGFFGVPAGTTPAVPRQDADLDWDGLAKDRAKATVTTEPGWDRWRITLPVGTYAIGARLRAVELNGAEFVVDDTALDADTSPVSVTVGEDERGIRIKITARQAPDAGGADDAFVDLVWPDAQGPRVLRGTDPNEVPDPIAYEAWRAAAHDADVGDHDAALRKYAALLRDIDATPASWAKVPVVRALVTWGYAACLDGSGRADEAWRTLTREIGPLKSLHGVPVPAAINLLRSFVIISVNTKHLEEATLAARALCALLVDNGLVDDVLGVREFVINAVLDARGHDAVLAVLPMLSLPDDRSAGVDLQIAEFRFASLVGSGRAEQARAFAHEVAEHLRTPDSDATGDDRRLWASRCAAAGPNTA
jgi:hypothetical protein